MSVTNLTPEELKTLQDYQVENNEIVAGLGTIELKWWYFDIKCWIIKDNASWRHIIDFVGKKISCCIL